jgi:predicted nucleic acid-binding protein
MVTFALDASALLRFLDEEAGADRVSDILADHLDGGCRVVMSAVNWGEIATKLFQRNGRKRFEEIFFELQSWGVEIVPATAERAANSGLIKAQKKIPYAGAFGVELAASIKDCVLVTGDFDMKPAAHQVKIEFLPKK